MPSVVVLIPGTDSDTATQRSASRSPNKQRKPLSLPSSSTPSTSLLSSTSQPRISAALPSALVLLPCPSSSTSRRPLQPSSSSSSLSSSSLLHNHSSSSSSASSNTSEPSSSRSRKGRHDRPIDFSNPFGHDDLYNSFKRVAPSAQDVYICRWRLRDKKGVLDPNGHQYCDAQLMTPDLLARHVLTQHIDQHSASQHPNLKIACKWNSCFNRHYDPAGLASHLVYDHFTQQMGLKYACVSMHCSLKTLLTSYEALDRHHAQYHAGTSLAQLRKLWQPKRPHKDPKRAAKILAAIRKLDAVEKSRPKVPVSANANPRLAPIDPRVRALQQVELKRRFMDPLNVELGDRQEGQPWIRLQKRIEKRIQNEDSKQAASDAIFRAIDYDQNHLDCIAPSFVESTGVPILQAIENGLQNAKLYHAGSSSSSQSPTARKPPDLTLPLPSPEKVCVVLQERGSHSLVESIGPTSLRSIEREMAFDSAITKQLRWADEVLGGSVALKPTSTQHSPLDAQSDGEIDEWEPSLPLDPYHPASRCRFALVEDSASDKPRAVQDPTETAPHVTSSGATSSASSRLTSPSVQSRSSSVTPIFGSDAALDPSRLKREREDDDDATIRLDREPPSSKVKLEEVPYIDLTSCSSDDLDAPAAQQEVRRSSFMFVELEQSARAISSPLGRQASAPRLQKASSTKEAGTRPASVS